MASSRIPLYRVKGTHYECARAIGVLAQEAIRQRIVQDIADLSTLFDFVRTDYGQKLHRDFINKTRLLYPWYWDEIRGLADGSEVPLGQILVLNFLNETLKAHRLFEEKNKLEEKHQQLENETGEKGCTTVLINRKDANILSLLHNEDHSTTLFTTAYLVEMDIQSSTYDENARESPREKFIAYCYAGCIPGNAFGVNAHGFAYSLNGLYPRSVAHGRLPRQIVNRALLSIRNENELDHLIHSSPVAFGFCINGGFIRQPSYLLNYEIGPNFNIDDQNHISKCYIVNSDGNIDNVNGSCIVNNYLVHYNHYERLDHVIPQQKGLQSSFSRWKRGQQIGEIFTVHDALNLLGDNEDKEYPIFRSAFQATVKSATLCTVHINFFTLDLIIYEENPKLANQSPFTYNVTQLLDQTP